MNIEEVRAYALSLKGVTEDMPFGEDCLTFRVGQKIFMCINLGALGSVIALKLLPETNEELREEFVGITPAYHWNKKHWSDVSLQSDVPDKCIHSLIDQSYHLVVSKLPKNLRLRCGL
ncbi:MmcQ family protein [Prevotella sp. oral taxon 376]|uniref:MmcQ/YjbR family DNA-binding protein n=1 Tax=Prevotella sp. oral taxon 376 TaxID=712466 RepID=UPI000D1E8B46|nr:MmcQ/YjbR family DNA-binding protein [Prevotella sp. oral taxon 376]PTL33581.1 MmcQ family protein [Prevotella sp. oral taxon 376]